MKLFNTGQTLPKPPIEVTFSNSGWQGNLELVYNYTHNTTQVKKAFAKAPLKLQSPFYPEGQGICHSVILHTAGGMVSGDTLTQNIHLETDTHALITTAAASKIYRSNNNRATQCITIQVDAGATLEWLPQETIIFNGAVYQQTVRVELAPGANWLGWEITRLGRSARGERFLDGKWFQNLEICREGKPLWIERQKLTASEEVWNSYHGLAGRPIIASLLWSGQPLSLDLMEQIRTLWKTYPYQGEAGITQILGDGLLCRYRGCSSSEVRHWFMAVWHLLRQSLLNCPPIYPRIFPK